MGLGNVGISETYPEVSKDVMEAKLSILKEVESQLLGWIDQSNSGFVSEDGVVERWVGGIDKKKVTKNIKEAAKKAKDKLKNL